MYTYTDKMDSMVCSVAQSYWRQRLSNSSLRRDDVVQFARLRVLEKQPPIGYIPRFVSWEISKEFVGHKERGYQRVQRYFVYEYKDIHIAQVLAGEITDVEYQTLVENLWATGAPKGYEVMYRLLHGETTHTIDHRILRQACDKIARAFTTKDSLLKTEPAKWLPRSALSAIKLFKQDPDNEKFTKEQRAFLARQL